MGANDYKINQTLRNKSKKIKIAWSKNEIIAKIFDLIVVSPASIEIPISSGKGVAIKIPAKTYKK